MSSANNTGLTINLNSSGRLNNTNNGLGLGTGGDASLSQTRHGISGLFKSLNSTQNTAMTTSAIKESAKILKFTKGKKLKLDSSRRSRL